MENERKPDIFDRIMAWGFLKRFEPFYKEHKEVLMYLFFGGCSTLVAIIFFALPISVLNIGTKTIFGFDVDLDVLIANIISWVFAVMFAYVTNRIWVFDSRVTGTRAVMKECAAFCTGRLFTLVVECVLLNVCTENIGIKPVIAKIIVSVVTIILNYIISKLLIFRKKEISG